jgi:hypothetical protein
MSARRPAAASFHRIGAGLSAAIELSGFVDRRKGMSATTCTFGGRILRLAVVMRHRGAMPRNLVVVAREGRRLSGVNGNRRPS